MIEHFQLLASYNLWMNTQIYESCARLSESEMKQDRGAYFGSIFGTLNHLLVADLIWCQRFAEKEAFEDALEEVAQHPKPLRLDQILYDDFAQLRTQRRWLDQLIERWVRSLDQEDLVSIVHYQNIRGQAFSKQLSHLLLHVFNHQTHHRGQITTLLSQAGEDTGATDLLISLPDQA